MVKTTELDPSQNYLSGFHPPEVLVVGAFSNFSNFCTEATGFSLGLSLFLKPHLLMLPCWFQVPLFRDCIMTSGAGCHLTFLILGWGRGVRAPVFTSILVVSLCPSLCPPHPGLVSSDKASASYLLTLPEGGQVAVLAVGGPLEASEAKPGTQGISMGAALLERRNVAVSLRRVSSCTSRASLGPVFSFGENELFQQYPNPPGSWVRRVQEALQARLSVALPLFHGRLGLLIPFRVPIHTVVGAPIPVPRSPRSSREQVDQLQALYVERLTQLFEEHKTRFGGPADQHLAFPAPFWSSFSFLPGSGPSLFSILWKAQQVDEKVDNLETSERLFSYQGDESKLPKDNRSPSSLRPTHLPACWSLHWIVWTVLSQPQLGQAVTIVIGGAQEALFAVPREHCITLRRRKGFVCLVLRHGASLVPVYSFGENDIYRIKSFDQNSWQPRCQDAFKRLTGFSPCIFWGHSLFSANLWGLVPFAQPITTVVRHPIPLPNPSSPPKTKWIIITNST
ncbi:hypothetical protein U0070_012619 [Myodes glareolus]|uniref:Acyltransferase n=1 Tax=Myodes glareolus TaxID=447135 RepID=A0AAW0JRF2_MYOGA